MQYCERNGYSQQRSGTTGRFPITDRDGLAVDLEQRNAAASTTFSANAIDPHTTDRHAVMYTLIAPREIA